MARQKQPQSTLNVVNLAGERPLVLAGPPAEIGGEIALQNNGEGKVVLRSARLRGDLPQLKKGEAHPLVAGLGTMVLRPGQVRSFPLQLNLNPHTPPGAYRVDLEIGDRVVPLELQVAEHVELSVSPNPLVVENRPGEKITKRLLFDNRGNVPLVIGQIGAVLIEDEQVDCRASRAALKNREGKFASVDDYYVQLGIEYTQIFEETGFLRVLNREDEVTVAPGEVRAIEFEIRIPDRLDRRARYHGRAPLFTTDLAFMVVPAPRGRRVEAPPPVKKTTRGKKDS